MIIRRRCTERDCKNARRSLEHLRFDVMFSGKRYRIPANEFAIPRMEPGKQRPIQSMEEARDWEHLFKGEPTHSVQSERTRGGDSRTAGCTRASRFCVRQRNRSLPTEHPDRPGNPAVTRARHRSKPGRVRSAMNREQLEQIDLRWHDLRDEGACRLLADGVDIRIIQLMLGHASIQQTQRYLNVTDEELRRGLEVSWNNKGRPLHLVSGS
jgi:hypothetical protein